MPEQETDIQLVKEFVDNLCRQALLISVEDAQRLVSEIDRMDTMMPLLDPTAYLRTYRKTIPGHLKAAIAFVKFRSALAEIVEDDAPEPSTTGGYDHV